MIIRKLKYSEIDVLKGFPPEEWHFDIISFMKLHFGKNYFFPVIAEKAGKIVGVGVGIHTGRTGWLGSIIVHEEERSRGMGGEITKYLIDMLGDMNCTSLLLIATDLGEPMYQKFGFETTDLYRFFKIDKTVQAPVQDCIRKISPKDFKMLWQLDRHATAEDRKDLLYDFTTNGYLYLKGESLGFFLPQFDQGLIVANDADAGLSLLQLKLSMGMKGIVIPDDNNAALEFLSQLGYTSYATAPRMLLGEPVRWKPEFIFSRAAGYCG